MYGKTFSENDSVHSHSVESIEMLEKLTSEARGNSSTIINGVTPQMLRLWVQHIRESIEAYRDLCDELEDDKDEIRHEYEEKVIQFFNRFMNADLTDETNYRAGELARLVHRLDNRVGELDNRCFRLDADLANERERSTQLEQRIEVLITERDLAKKLAKQKSEELKRKFNEKYGINVACMELKDKLDRKCREVGELTSVVVNLQYELDHVYEKIELIKADRDRYFKQLHESGYFDTDITHMYFKTTLKLNNPQNFCGNCKHFVTHPCDIATCNNKHADPYIVDPDDASCPHFEPNQVDRDKPDQPCCEACNREDCDNCTLCPF